MNVKLHKNKKNSLWNIISQKRKNSNKNNWKSNLTGEIKKIQIKISFPKNLKFGENLQILFSGYYYREESKIGGGHNT